MKLPPEAQELYEECLQTLEAGLARLNYLTQDQIAVMLAERDLLLFFVRRLAEEHPDLIPKPLRHLHHALLDECQHDF